MQRYRQNDEPAPGFALVQFLGRGRFGEVWTATGPGGVSVALNMIPLPDTRTAGDLRAVRLLRQLHHPNLVTVLGLWLKGPDGRPVEGWEAGDPAALARPVGELVVAMTIGEKSLRDRLHECQQEGRDGIPVAELIDYMEDAARALDYLNEARHQFDTGPASIPHGDLKPSTILVVANAAQVCNFGLSHLLGPDDDNPPSPAYLAPELVTGKPTPTSDQYSLAVSYLELRSGKVPFANTDTASILSAHLSGRLDYAGLSPAEERVLRKALSLRPEDRFPRALDFVQALRKAMPQDAPARPLSVMTDDPVRPGRELVPGYRLVRLLGKGGYGEVWQAMAPGGKGCALKIIRELDARTSAQEFGILELLKTLEHDHLMSLQAYWLLDRRGRVMGGDDEQGVANMLVLCTPLAVKNLAQRLKECHEETHKGIPIEELLKYMRQAAEAIDYMNAAQHEFNGKLLAIQHRDIKPENILLTAGGSVKITDFGLAKMVEGTSAHLHTQSRSMTVPYAAPEMFRGEVTSWTDQYSLALTYFKLRTGRFPFDIRLPPFVLMTIHTEGKLDLSSLGEAERAVLARATSRVPDQRFEDCQEMVEALREACGVSELRQRGKSGAHKVVRLPSGEGPGSGDATAPPTRVGTVPGAADSGAVNYGTMAPPPVPEGTVTNDIRGGSGRLGARGRGPDTNADAADTAGAPGTHAAGEETPVPGTLPRSGARPDPSRGAWRGSEGGGRRRLILGALAVLLVAGIAGAVWFFTRPTDKPDNPRQGIEDLLTAGQFPEALQKLDAATLPGDEKNQLRDRVRDLWLARVEKPVPDDALKPAQADVDSLLKFYPDESRAKAVQKQIATRLDDMSSAGGKLVAEAKALIAQRKLAEAIAKLEEAATHEQVKSRAEALRDVTRIALDEPVTLKEALVKLDPALRPDAEPLREVYVRLLIESLPENPDWALRLKDCKDAGPTSGPWVIACRVECLAEMRLARHEVKDAEWAAAWRDLANLTELREAAAYIHYTRALGQWSEGDTVLAAREMEKALPQKEPSTEVAVPHRTAQAGKLFRAGADQLRALGTFEYPFGTVENAGNTHDWLLRSEALSGKPLDVSGRAALALAAWHRDKRDEALARERVAALLAEKDLDKTLVPVDRYRLWLIRAATSGADRVQALDASREAVALAHDLFKQDPNNQFLAASVHRDLLAPALEGGGKKLLGDAPTDEVKKRSGPVFGGLGSLLKTNPLLWSSEQFFKKRSAVLSQAADLFAAAYRNTGEPEHLVQESFLRHRLGERKPADMKKDAETALDKKKFLEGHMLMALALLGVSREEDDHKQKLKTLDDAYGHCKEGWDRFGATGDPEEKSDLRRYWSSVCIEKAVYVPEKKAKEDLIAEAVRYAREATELNARNLDAWDALAFALEEEAEALGKKENYQEAVAAFDKAVAQGGFNLDRLHQCVGRARCRYKWAAALDAGKEKGDLLDAAEAELNQVIAQEADSVEAAEANYFLAHVARERRKFTTDPVKKAGLLKDAEKHLRAAIKAAREARVPSKLWEEVAAVVLANQALNEARERKAAGAGDAEAYLKEADTLANDLKTLHPIQSIVNRAEVSELRGEGGKKVLEILEEKPAKERQQDRVPLGWLLLKRAGYQMSQTPPNPTAALKDADAAADKLIATEGKEVGALIEGLRGQAKALQARTMPQQAAALRDQAIGHFRAAIRDAPEHPNNWIWHWQQARELWVKTGRTAKEADEARDLMREARKRLPKTAPAAYRDSLLNDYERIVGE